MARIRWPRPTKCRRCAGNKFTPRVLNGRGQLTTLRVRANHPEYKLRTRALRSAAVCRSPTGRAHRARLHHCGAGDSWFANTPRRGGILDRVTSVHQETSLCVACHVSHFSPARADVRHTQRLPDCPAAEVQFLTERFYNNPRPFYGFEERRSGLGARHLRAGQRARAACRT